MNHDDRNTICLQKCYYQKPVLEILLAEDEISGAATNIKESNSGYYNS